ncbi:MAG: endonuclease YncB(thermonuclease family) [Afipia broomeae]|jgi:endonuclease YncB( thermonuclease family)
MNRRIPITFCCAVLLTAGSGGSLRAACEFALQGEGRVSGVLDVRTFRLGDGREIRLAGIEPAGDIRARGKETLASLIDGRDVTLRSSDDGPDRYGRQHAFVFLKDMETPIQSELLTRGEALASPVTDRSCSTALVTAEAAARAARRGIWASSAAIKNAESTDDILAGVGRFTVVEGTVSSARLAGAVFYVNFGRRWTRDFAATISRRMMPSLESAGIDLKSLKNKRVRVRGWIEKRGGPRIEVTYAGQIELIAAADVAANGTMPRDEGK